MNLKSFHMVAASPSAAKNMARNIAPKKEEKMKWISVKDQMPKDGEVVILLFDTGLGRISGQPHRHFVAIVGMYCCSRGWITQNVIAPDAGKWIEMKQMIYFWAPLPEFPVVKYEEFK